MWFFAVYKGYQDADRRGSEARYSLLQKKLLWSQYQNREEPQSSQDFKWLIRVIQKSVNQLQNFDPFYLEENHRKATLKIWQNQFLPWRSQQKTVKQWKEVIKIENYGEFHDGSTDWKNAWVTRAKEIIIDQYGSEKNV